MTKTKYYAAIAAAQAAQNEPERLEPFDFEVLAAKGLAARLGGAGDLLAPLYAFSRRFMPLLPLAGLLHVTRAEQVREILLRPQDFEVPFGPEMAELGDGGTFMLGLEGPEHDRLNRILHGVFRRADGDRIAAMSLEFGSALLANSAGQIDVVADLIKRVPSEICLRFFGLACDDIDAFGDWTMALSAFLFGDPYGKPEIRKLAMNAKRRLGLVLSDALARTQRRHRSGLVDADAGTLIERLVLIQAEERLTDTEIGAMLMGLAVGFVPTNTLAASNMLMELLKRPAAMAKARAAATANDRVTMRLIVREAGRLNPALAPGQWRYVPRDTTLAVGRRLRTIKAGTTLLVSTMSALRDPRAVDLPGEFRIDRTNPDGSLWQPDLLFGVGPHYCLGEHLAVEQISALFTALLRCEGLARAKGAAGKLRRTGPFPRHLTVTWQTPASTQSMFLVIAEVSDGATKYAVDKTIAALGNPAGAGIRAALDATGVVHFGSLATIHSDKALHITFELSVDGTPETALAAIAAQAEALLRPVFAHAGFAAYADLTAFLTDHVVELHGKPWGANGLNYNGLGEFAVREVERQAKFADFADRVLRDYVASETARGSHPTLAMAHLRRILRGDPGLKAEASPAQNALIDEAREQGFDAVSLMTDAARLKLSTYRKESHGKAFVRFLTGRDGRIVLWPLLAMAAIFAALFWPSASGPLAWGLLATLTKAVLATALIATLLITAFLIRLRSAETSDIPDTSQAPLDQLRTFLAQENPPGHAHNHILAVGTMKPGWFRAFVHAFALWGIKMVIVYGFRPGFVINMGTIHYARWWRLPGTNKVCFYSNFDGSWESYLEDFITRARQGQSASWSNWQGFPRTRFLIGQGAQDGDAFKRWVRTVQQVVPFWYSRFPELTTDLIRGNALIHAGAGLARSPSDCEEWLRCFGSMPRMANRIESDEVQALVFRGMKRLPYSAVLALRLPPAGEALGEWLSWLRGKPMQAGLGGAGDIAALVEAGVLIRVPRPAGRPPEYALAHSLGVAFGDRPLTGDDAVGPAEPVPTGDGVQRDAMASARQAVFFGLSGAGMARFEAPNSAEGTLLEAFPYAYRMGMAARAKINGDFGANAPGNWRWQDDPRDASATQAVLMVFAASPEELTRARQVHELLLANHGGSVLSATDCAPAFADPAKADFEHFGYRDGISQPVIKGTTRSLRGVPERDQIEPGEFILGYRNGPGFYPPSPLLPREADMAGALPPPLEADLSRYPDFGEKALSEGPRDLGRNGTYLVLRELRQDVEGFEHFCADSGVRLNAGGLGELYKLTGQRADADWVKAKLMGRWPDGRPLIGNPVQVAADAIQPGAERENDFAYGTDDPQGLACPFGAHIRRSNPRDSKAPGDVAEQAISNRHRLLRRGRAYTRPETGEKGLLFASVCADIERQFEFVQQFWANAPAFHGLNAEPDPIAGNDPLDPDGTPIDARVFTIPTVAGPVRLDGLKSFVTTMAGGYFFLPSRSALGWLTETALHAPQRTES